MPFSYHSCVIMWDYNFVILEYRLIIMPPPLIGGALRHAFVWRLSAMYIGPKSRKRGQKRPRKNNIGTGVAHVTRDSDTTFKFKRSRSPGHFTHHGLNASGSCSGERENVLGVGNYCYVAVCSAVLGAHRGRRGAGAYRGGRPPTACLKHLLYITISNVCLSV